MNKHLIRIVAVLVAMMGLNTSLSSADIRRPRLLDPALEISLIASEPEIVTPIGVACDNQGRLFVVESNTHFTPADYSGAKSDRIKLFQDTNGDGRPDKMTVFAEGFRYAMNLSFSPGGQLFLSHRNGIMILNDKDGDGVSESTTTVLTLETQGNYPHNGIGGLAFSGDGWLYVGMGENLGADYVLKGSDGSRHAGGGEGGNVFRCRPDGSQLEVVATGFWNAFALEFTSDGYLICADNDPDSRPPCRLVDVVPGGDYGFKFRFGRNGLHPYESWNGELPGTLPMLAGTGEAPSGVLNCDRARLPLQYRHGLLVTSWGDHHLEFYHPVQQGASLRADREIVAEGDDSFRPVGITAAPDGSIYFTDWVDKSYPVHGQGRIWRLTSRNGVREKSVPKTNPERTRMTRLAEISSKAESPVLFKALTDSDPFILSAAITGLARETFRDQVINATMDKNPRIRLGALLALRRSGYNQPETVLRKALADSSEAVRRIALVWIGESKIESLTGALDTALSAGPVSAALFQTHAATKRILGENIGKKNDHPATPIDASVQTFALEMSLSQDPATAIKLLNKPESIPAATLWEAIRALAEQPGESAARALANFALNSKAAPEVRADAVLALTTQPGDTTKELLAALDDRTDVVRLEAVRALTPHTAIPKISQRLLRTQARVEKSSRLSRQLAFTFSDANDNSSQPQNPRPKNEADWIKALAVDGDQGAGRRVFYSPNVGCYRCHQIKGHGGMIGPDLSTIARASSREKIIQSILEPSREIAPQFVSYNIETSDGGSFSGLLAGVDSSGTLTLTTTDARGVLIPEKQIIKKETSRLSLMPEGLEKGMSTDDFRDLLAFLTSLK